MLQRNYENIAKLRDYLIENRPADFDMDQWEHCVAAYACRVLDGDRAMPQPPMMAEARVAELLGIDRYSEAPMLCDACYLDGEPRDGNMIVTMDVVIDRLEALGLDREMVL